MKKLIYLLLILPGLAFAQSDASLNTEADTIKNETVARKNNATRFWRMFRNVISGKINKDSLEVTTTGTTGPATIGVSGSRVTINVPQYNSFSLPANADGVLNNDGSGTLSWRNINSGTWNNLTLLNSWATGSHATYRILNNKLEVSLNLDTSSATNSIFATVTGLSGLTNGVLIFTGVTAANGYIFIKATISGTNQIQFTCSNYASLSGSSVLVTGTMSLDGGY
jgi:hypothetical protein